MTNTYNSRNLIEGFDCKYLLMFSLIYNSRNLIEGFD